MSKLTQERLKEVLDYDPETGEFWWRRNDFKAGSTGNDGYVSIPVYGKTYKAHRLAWLYVYGYFPENQVDHINRVRGDNRVVNLREVSQSCNMRNKAGHSGSASGVKGILKRGDKWGAHIGVGDRNINLGTFLTKLGAAKARVAAEIEHGFNTCDRLSEAQIFVNSQPPEESDSRLRKPSSSGKIGVNWNTQRGKWQAKIYRGIQIHLGFYDTIEEAAKARIEAEKKYRL